jgi:hypothetical protein
VTEHEHDPDDFGDYEHHYPLRVQLVHFLICLIVVGITTLTVPAVLETYETGNSTLWGPDGFYHAKEGDDRWQQ